MEQAITLPDDQAALVSSNNSGEMLLLLTSKSNRVHFVFLNWFVKPVANDIIIGNKWNEVARFSLINFSEKFCKTRRFISQ
jgi:hypothetical protein